MFFKKHYLKMDLYRAFFSWKCPLCILTVALCFYWGGKSNTVSYIPEGVLEMLSKAFFGGMTWLALVPCVFVYGDCLCEDYERKFFRTAIQRGNSKAYLNSKFVCCFLSAYTTMCLGFLLSCFFAGLFQPFFTSEYTYDCLCQTLFGSLLRDGNGVLYEIAIGLLYSLQAGILAVASMALSMWYPNRLLVYAMPVFLFYVIDALTGRLPPPFQVLYIFNAMEGSRLGSPLLSVGWALLVTLLFSCALYFMMYQKIRKWIENG